MAAILVQEIVVVDKEKINLAPHKPGSFIFSIKKTQINVPIQYELENKKLIASKELMALTTKLRLFHEYELKLK